MINIFLKNISMNTRILFLIRNFTVDKMFLKKVFDNVDKTGANPDNFQRGGLRQFFFYLSHQIRDW